MKHVYLKYAAALCAAVFLLLCAVTFGAGVSTTLQDVRQQSTIAESGGGQSIVTQ